MKNLLIALGESALTAIYWWGFINVSYALFGGDPHPDAPLPSESQIMLQTAITIGLGIVAYAVLILAWRRLLKR